MRLPAAEAARRVDMAIAESGVVNLWASVARCPICGRECVAVNGPADGAAREVACRAINLVFPTVPSERVYLANELREVGVCHCDDRYEVAS